MQRRDVGRRGGVVVLLQRRGGSGVEQVRVDGWVVRPRHRQALSLVLHATILKPDLRTHTHTHTHTQHGWAGLLVLRTQPIEPKHSPYTEAEYRKIMCSAATRARKCCNFE